MPNVLWKNFELLFIPPHLHDGGLLRGKARTLTLVHVALFVVTLISVALHLTVLPQKNQEVLFSPLIASAMIYFFRRFGNFTWSGNVISGALAFSLMPSAAEFGYLLSDDFQWLILCPVLAGLFCNGSSTLSWYAIYCGFAFYIFQKQSASIDVSHGFYEPAHYLVSYVFLTGFLTAVAFLYQKNENLIFEAMQHNQRNLEMQRQELTAQAAEMQRLHEQLTKSHRELETFAYSAGHDLKEPLRMITAYIQLLKRRLGSDLSAESQEFMDYITQGASRMQRLIEDLLEFSRVGRGKDKPTLVDLDDVLYHVRNNLKLAIEENGARLDVQEPLPKVVARYSEMVQLFQNLLGNALKFRQKDVPPLLRVGFTEGREKYSFFVADNGLGIPQEACEKVFAPFIRLHSKSEIEGSGLGLAICKKIVDSVGGDIWLESEVGVGTTFFFTVSKQNLPFSAEKLSNDPAKTEKVTA